MTKLFHIIESREDFDSQINKNGVVVVDFFGTWCGPCTSLANSLENISQTNKTLTQATFVKVDVDDFSDLAELYNVSALPFLIFFKNGKLTEYFVKGNDKDGVIQIVEKLLN